MRAESLSLANIEFLKTVLPRIDFFTPVTGEQYGRLLPFVLAERFNAGEIVFSEGDPGDAFYVLFDGSVHLRAQSGWFGGSKTIARLVPGQYFGEMALITGAPRMATAVCAEPSFLLQIKAEDFALVIEENPEVAAVIERVAAERSGGRPPDP